MLEARAIGPPAQPAAAGRRPSLGAFILLAGYAAIRWASLLGNGGQRRLYGVLVIAVLLAVGIRAVGRLRAPAALAAAVAVLTLLALLAMLAVAGIPLDWLYAARVERILHALSDGASNLPKVLLPYIGAGRDPMVVIVIGAGGLMLCAALAFGSARPDRGSANTAQLAIAAVLLVAVAVVPSAIDRPHAALFHGVVTFVLAAALVLSPRVGGDRGPAALGLIALATLLGIIGGRVIDNHGAWITSDAIHVAGAPTATKGAIELFSWEQGYGALGPRTGQTVLTVSAPRSSYWKAEDLDRFNGRVWEQGVSSANGLEGVSQARISADTETIKVTIGQMTTQQVITGGYALSPQLDGAVPGTDPGIWRTQFALQPLDSYTEQAYVPDPSPQALSSTGWRSTHYPPTFASLAKADLPGRVYAPVVALANHLARGQHSTYGFMQAAIAYLRAHETYTISPPSGGAYPIAGFLEHTHAGYCQQFAGALALLLRIRGIPVRVAVGFLPGRHQFASDNYFVSDRDAHAWDEVYFPGYGWITADPTPASTASDSGTGGGQGSGLFPGHGTHQLTHKPGTARKGKSATAGGPKAAGHAHHSALLWPWIVLAALAAGLGGAGLWFMRRRQARAVEELIAELETAFLAGGQPLEPDVTLSVLAGRLGGGPAAGYVQALAAARYTPDGRLPDPEAGRRALRRRLSDGRPARVRWQVLRALPPRRERPGRGEGQD